MPENWGRDPDAFLNEANDTNNNTKNGDAMKPPAQMKTGTKDSEPMCTKRHEDYLKTRAGAHS